MERHGALNGRRAALVLTLASCLMCVCSTACPDDGATNPTVPGGKENPGERAVEVPTVSGLGTYLRESMRSEWLKPIASGAPEDPEKDFMIDESACSVLGGWVGRPIAVKQYEVKGCEVHARLESDFLVLWVRSTDAGETRPTDPSDVAAEACKRYLRENIGFPVKKPRNLVLAPRYLDGSNALVCSFYPEYQPGDAPPVSRVSLLIKGQDTVIVLEKAKARQVGQRLFCSGPATESEEVHMHVVSEAEQAQLPEDLVNGCIWPR